MASIGNAYLLNSEYSVVNSAHRNGHNDPVRFTNSDVSLAVTFRQWGPKSSPEKFTVLCVDASTGTVTAPFAGGSSTCVLETTSWANERCVPRGVAIEPSGTILIADVGRNKVVRLSRNGTVLAEWG